MNDTTTRRVGSHIRWSDDQYEEIAAEMARIKFEDITCYSFTKLATMAMEIVIDKTSWRDLIMVPDNLRLLYVTACDEYRAQFVLKSLIEVPEPIVDAEAGRKASTMQELMAEIGERQDLLLSKVIEIGERPPTVNIQTEVASIPSLVRPPVKPKKIRIALIGLLADQIKHLQNDLRHHADRIELRPFAKGGAHHAPSTFRVDHVVCLDKTNHAERDKAHTWVSEPKFLHVRSGISEMRRVIQEIAVPPIRMPLS